MQRLRILLILMIVTTTLALGACATAKPCVPLTINPSTDEDCPVGGTYCGASEGQFCSGTWPFRKHCKTVYLIGGSCICRCE